MFDLALPTLAMVVVAAAFWRWRASRQAGNCRMRPGDRRAILINLVQVAITFATNHLWLDLLSGVSLFHLPDSRVPCCRDSSAAGSSAHSSSTGGIESAISPASGLSSTRFTILRRASRL
jgi:hypothetical protein